MRRSRPEPLHLVLAALLAVTALSDASPAFAQAQQSGGGGSGGSETPTTGPAKAANRRAGNGALQAPSQPAKKPADGPLPFIAAYTSVLPGGGTFSIDTKGITLQTVDNTAKFRIGGRMQIDGSVANLKPGTYQLFCNVPGHYNHGMHTIVTVK